MKRASGLILLWILIGLLGLQVVGCAGIKTRRQVEKEKAEQQTERDDFSTEDKDVSEQEGIEGDFQEVPPAPAPVAKIPKVGVILGPGGFRAFSHAGVLKQLEKARIPIDAVVGLEWGAVIGALYAQNGQVHEVEWKLYKMEKKDLPGRSFFFNEFKAEPVDVLSGFFKDNFGRKKVQTAEVPFACPALSLWSGILVWQKEGAFSSALEKCLPFPPLFRPKGPWLASSFALKESIKYLKDQGMELIVFVNVLGQGDLFERGQLLEQYQSAILWQELRRALKRNQGLAHEVIDVPVENYKLFDFEKRKALVQAGEKAGRDAAQRLSEKYGF